MAVDFAVLLGRMSILSLALTICTRAQDAAADNGLDGVPIIWKTGGVYYTSRDGAQHRLDLKSQGASPQHRDILVWVDWMAASNDPVPHKSHQPIPAAIRAVQTAFAQAPVSNPDGSKGINLIVIVSPDPVLHMATLGTGTEASIWADFEQIKESHLPKELAGVFHYCLFAHDINVPGSPGTSGIARIGGTDLIVSLGSWVDPDGNPGNEDEQTGTFMHELGHNLGLQHGGKDAIRYKPNFLSVMNYFFQNDGLRVPQGSLRFDYSHAALADLDENDLDETAGMTSGSQFQGWSTLYFCPGQWQAIDPPVSIISPIDWNCDGVLTQHVASHISGPLGSATLTSLMGYDDWGHVTLKPPTPDAGLPPLITLSVRDETSLSDANRIPIPPVTGLSAIVVNGKLRISWNRLPQSRVVGYKITCTDATGKKIVVTTQQTSFEDSISSNSAARYEVQGLYRPHGSANLVKVAKTVAGYGRGLELLNLRDPLPLKNRVPHRGFGHRPRRVNGISATVDNERFAS